MRILVIVSSIHEYYVYGCSEVSPNILNMKIANNTQKQGKKMFIHIENGERR